MELRDYLDATVETSNRSRYILYILLAASLIAFASNWNSRKGTWLKQGLEATQTSCMLLELREEFLEDENFFWLKNPEAIHQAIVDRLKTLRESPEKLDAKAAQTALLCGFLEKTKAQEIKRGLEIIHSHQKDKTAMNEHRRDLEELYLQHSRVAQMPILGLSFDVKELGVIAGVAFTVLLLLLSMSVAREKQDLEKTFAKAARQGSPAILRECYEYLAAKQVIAFPPELDAEDREERVSRRTSRLLVKLLLFCPFFVMTMILRQEISVLDQGAVINGLSAWRTVISAGGFTLLTLLFGAICATYFSEVNQVWEQWRERIAGPAQAAAAAVAEAVAPEKKPEEASALALGSEKKAAEAPAPILAAEQKPEATPVAPAPVEAVSTPEPVAPKSLPAEPPIPAAAIVPAPEPTGAAPA